MVCHCVHMFVSVFMCLCRHVCKNLTCKEKARKAGMGMRAAIKNAIMLLMEVRATLVPVRRKQSPVLSFKTNTVISQGEESKEEERRVEERRLFKIP